MLAPFDDPLVPVLLFGGVFVFVMMTMPALIYLYTGWMDRKLEIMSLMGTGAMRLYLCQFPPAGLTPEAVANLSDQAISNTFRAYYDRRFGRRQFVLPLVVYMLILVALLTLCGITLYRGLQGTSHGELPNFIAFAIAGALMWVLSDLLTRTQSRTLRPGDVHWMSFRLLIAAPLAAALCYPFIEEFRWSVAFLLGVFPTRTLLKIGRRTVMQRLNASPEQASGRESNLQDLQSIDRQNAERFADDGIRNILELAYCDPVAVAIRTNLDFIYVLDCMSQALFWIYVEEKLDVARESGLRGACEVVSLCEDLDSEQDETRTRAERLVHHIATRMEIDVESLRNVLREVAHDPYGQFVYQTWLARICPPSPPAEV